MPERIALAGLVPCADLGIRQTFLCPCPFYLRYCEMVNNPAYYPLAPEFGWKEISSNFVTDFR